MDADVKEALDLLHTMVGQAHWREEEDVHCGGDYNDGDCADVNNRTCRFVEYCKAEARLSEILKKEG